jgi:hypothetical protein
MGTSVVDRADYITLSLPYHLAFKLCLDSLSEFGNQRIILEDRAQGRIEAALLPEPIWKTPLNSCLRISFRLGSDEEGITKVEFMSKAALPTVRFDFGQNEKNVNQIRTFLQKSSSPHKTMK